MRVESVTDREGYLEARIEGPFEIRDLQGVFKTVAEAVQSRGTSRLLLHNLGVTGRPPSTLERYEISMAVLALPGSLRVPMVSREEAIDPNRFGQMVAQNRGLQLKVFSQEGPAIAWLREANL